MKFSLRGLFTILGVLFISSLWSQPSPGKPGNRPNGPGEGYGIITGALHDATTREHVEYGNVLLYRAADSSMLTGTISDIKGKFLFEKLQPGNYYLKIQFIGYENKLIPGIQISDRTADVKLGDLWLQPRSSTLSAVEITAEKSLITNNLDKKIVTVDKNLALGGATAADVMENVPSVTVDAEGNVSLRGNSNITLLVDGKPSSQAGLAASDVLNQIPASAIESVEVITNPSVRYDPDGTSGIINIVLKKKALQGFNGMISANAGTGDKYNGSLNLNYRKNQVNFFLNADARSNPMSTSMESNRIISGSESSGSLRQSQQGTMVRNMYSVSGGMDYFIDTRNSLTFSIQKRRMEFGSEGLMLNNSMDENDTLLRYFERYSESLRRINSTDYSLSYKHLFPQKGREYTNDVIFSSNRMNNELKTIQEDYDQPGGIQLGDPSFSNNLAQNTNQSLTIQGNYIYPMTNGSRIETGYKAAFRDLGMQYDYRVFNDSTQTWESQESLKNYFDYFDQIYAVYGIYANSFGKWKYQAGLRFEQAFTDSEVELTKKTYSSKYSSLYPSLHTRYDLGKNRELQFSYSRRVNRPSPRELNPYMDYSDSLNIRTGNPGLAPTFTSSFEIGFNKFWDQSSLSTTAFYRATRDEAEDISILQDDGITMTMPLNVASSASYGLEWVGSATPYKWLKMNANLSVFRYTMSSIPELDISGSERLTWSGRLNLNFTPWKNGSFQLIGSYTAPTRSVQEYEREQYFADASFRQDFLKNALSVTLRLTDIFNTRTFHETTYGNGFITESKRFRESRVFYAGIQYRINNYNKKASRESVNGEGGDSEGF